MSHITEKGFIWENKCKIKEIPLYDLDVLCNRYEISNPQIKIIVKESIDKPKTKKPKDK